MDLIFKSRNIEKNDNDTNKPNIKNIYFLF